MENRKREPISEFEEQLVKHLMDVIQNVVVSITVGVMFNLSFLNVFLVNAMMTHLNKVM